MVHKEKLRKPGGLLLCTLLPGTQLVGFQEEVQLREQDWGNFQAPGEQARNYEARLKYGRFFYRFPDGESAADVYDRMTM